LKNFALTRIDILEEENKKKIDEIKKKKET